MPVVILHSVIGDIRRPRVSGSTFDERTSGGAAYSPDWRDNGSLMIVDEYDTVDRSSLSPNFIADPRMTSRATLYQFGPDHKVHVICTIAGGGFWIKP